MVCANVTISGDTFFENDETFTVTLTTSDSQTIVQSGRNVATVTITDDDCECVCVCVCVHVSGCVEACVGVCVHVCVL